MKSRGDGDNVEELREPSRFYYRLTGRSHCFKRVVNDSFQ